MRPAARIIAHFEEIAGALLLLGMCAAATVQAGSRLLSQITTAVRPVFWTEEACTLLFIWLSFVGASYALRTGDHFAVEVLREKLPAPAARCIRVMCLAGVVLFAGLLVWFGGQMTYRSLAITMPALQVPRSVAYAAVPAGGALMLVRAAEMLVRDLVGRPQQEGDTA
jgi:TRAP-type C4-dicarboxylate transport system permease small subunit